MQKTRKRRAALATLLKAVRVWLYARVSTAKQVRKDDREYGSLDKQRSSMEAFVERRHHLNWELTRPGPVLDPAESGDEINRPGIQEILEAARNHEFEVLVVYNYDRLARDWNVAKMILSELEACGVTVWVVSANAIVSLDPIEEYRRAMSAFCDAEAELWKIRKRKSADMHQYAMAGIWHGTRAPLGYRAQVLTKSRVLKVDPATAKIVVELMKRLTEGEPVGAILADFARRPDMRTRAITKKGMRTKGSRLITWDLVNKIVHNPIYAGFTSIRNFDPKRHVGRDPFQTLPGGTALFEGKHQKLVNFELWLSAMKAFDERGRIARAPRSVDVDGKFVLQGLLWCHECGRRMTNKGSGNGSGVYRCMSVVEKTADHAPTCRVGSVSAPVVEDAVLRLVERVVQSPEIVDAILKHGTGAGTPTGKKGLARLTRDLKAASKACEKLTSAIHAAQHKDTIKALASEFDAVAARRAQIQRDIDAAWDKTPIGLRSAAGIRSMLSKLAEVSPLLNRRKLKEVYRSLLQRIEVSAGKTSALERTLRIELQVRSGGSPKCNDTSTPLRLEINVPKSRVGTYSITKPFREARDCAITKKEEASGPKHCLQVLSDYTQMARTMKQREIAKTIDKTPAHVCQILGLAAIPLRLRHRILSSQSAKQSFGLKRLMELAKMPGPAQEAQLSAIGRS